MKKCNEKMMVEMFNEQLDKFESVKCSATVNAEVTVEGHTETVSSESNVEVAVTDKEVTYTFTTNDEEWKLTIKRSLFTKIVKVAYMLTSIFEDLGKYVNFTHNGESWRFPKK